MRFRFEDDANHTTTFVVGIITMMAIGVVSVIFMLEYFFGIAGFLVIPIVAFGFPVLYAMVNIIVSVYERIRKSK
jgi:hypothetical protein